MRIDNTEDVLLVVDMQNDHVSGTLEHPGASTLIAPINRLAQAFGHIIVVKDWHPPQHVSFFSGHAGMTAPGDVDTYYGGQFAGPDHCVQGTWGAELDPKLELARAELEFRKGYRKDVDSYSAFHMLDGTPTGFAELLRVRGLKRVFGVGVGKYGCVAHTLKGAIREGFAAVIVEDGGKQNWGHRANSPEEARRLDERAAGELLALGVGSIYSDALLG